MDKENNMVPKYRKVLFEIETSGGEYCNPDGGACQFFSYIHDDWYDVNCSLGIHTFITRNSDDGFVLKSDRCKNLVEVE